MSQNPITNNNPSFKHIHVGSLIEKLIQERKMCPERICKFFNFSETKLKEIYKEKSLNTDILLKFSKLLDYDFFRLYSHHLILYASPSSQTPEKETTLPKFRKNLYTQEIIDFVLEQIRTGEKSKSEVIEDYRIPKTTLYKWITKYENN